MEKNSYEIRESIINLIINFFLLAGHKVDFIALCRKKNFFLTLLVEKKSCAIRKNINFIHVVVTLALLRHQTLHSQNKFFFPSCTIYYFLSSCITYYSFREGKARNFAYIETSNYLKKTHRKKKMNRMKPFFY